MIQIQTTTNFSCRDSIYRSSWPYFQNERRNQPVIKEKNELINRNWKAWMHESKKSAWMDQTKITEGKNELTSKWMNSWIE